MYMTEKVKAALPAVVEWTMTFPKDLCFTLDQGLTCGAALRVAIQARNQSAVADVRAMAPKRLVWKKTYSDEHNWWEYDAFSPTLSCDIHIYAVREAPPTCRVERRVEMVEISVPVTFETKMIEREVVEVYCGEGV